MSKTRQSFRNSSNNTINTNKNMCALAVATFFMVEDSTRYLHTMYDLKRALRTKYSVRSVLTLAGGKNVTVGKARRSLANNPNPYVVGYVVQVTGHVLVLDTTGKTVRDTAQKARDRRKIISVYGIYINKATVRAFPNP